MLIVAMLLLSYSCVKCTITRSEMIMGVGINFELGKRKSCGKCGVHWTVIVLVAIVIK